MRALSFLVLAISLLVPARLSARMETAYSPDNNIVVNFDVKDGIPVYNVSFKGKQVIGDSRLGLELVSAKGNGEFNNFDSHEAENQNSLRDGFTMMTSRYSSLPFSSFTTARMTTRSPGTRSTAISPKKDSMPFDSPSTTRQ